MVWSSKCYLRTFCTKWAWFQGKVTVTVHLITSDPYVTIIHNTLIKVADIASHPNKNPLAEFVIVVFLPDDPRGAAEGHRRHAEELTSWPGDRDGPESGTAHYILHQGKVPHSQVLYWQIRTWEQVYEVLDSTVGHEGKSVLSGNISVFLFSLRFWSYFFCFVLNFFMVYLMLLFTHYSLQCGW